MTPSQAPWGATSGDIPSLVTTQKPVSLYLEGVQLNESFDAKPPFGDGINEIRLLGVAWDLSGRPPYIFAPDLGSGPHFRMRVNESLSFMGDGLQLWPNSPVTGGLNVRLLVLESDGKERGAALGMAQAKRAVEESQLPEALKDLGLGPTAGALAAVGAASAALDGALFHLAGNRDDHVALFDGTYGAELLDQRPADATEVYDRPGASVKLRLLVGDPRVG